MPFRLAGVIAGILLLTGCSSSGSWSEARVEASAAGSSSAGAPKPPSPSARPDRPTADGTDVAACRDGRCEILVRDRAVVPLDPRFGFAAMTVTFVPPDRTLFSATDTQGGTFSGEIGGKGQLGANDITVEVVDLGPGGVVLRFAPRS